MSDEEHHNTCSPSAQAYGVHLMTAVINGDISTPEDLEVQAELWPSVRATEHYSIAKSLVTNNITEAEYSRAFVETIIQHDGGQQ